VSTEDVNQKFLRSLPSSWSQVSLIMRTKPGVETVSFDDLYNNFRVFETDVKCSTASSSSTQNVASVSSNSTSSTNEVCTAYGVSTSNGHNSQRKGSSSYTDELIEYISKGNQESRKRDTGNTGDKTGHAEDDTENYALIAFNSSNSGSDTEVTFCSKECEKTYAKLKKLYDEQREKLGDASIEIQAYTLALKKMSVKDKSRLGYETQIHEGVLSYENEILKSVFDTRSTDEEDSHDNPHQTLRRKGIVNSGCSRHMTENKAYLVEYQDFNGGHVAFGGSKGQII
nr:hypothetical protein [Tanacetum cinerariifolium]